MKTSTKVAGGTLAAVVLLGGGIAIGSLTGGPDEPAPTTAASDSATTSAAPEPGGAGPIAAGEGGSTVAADGVTPVGFDPTCVGAVQAAAAYAVAVQNPTTGTGIGTEDAEPGDARPGLQETLDRIMVGDDDSLDTLRKSAVPNDLVPGWTVDPTQGGYKVVECIPGQRAVVSLFACETYNEYPGPFVEYEGFSSCGTGTWFMSWGGDPQDWRVASQKAGGPDDSTITPDQAPAAADYGNTEWPVPLPADERHQYLSSVPGWVEFSNAPE